MDDLKKEYICLNYTSDIAHASKYKDLKESHEKEVNEPIMKILKLQKVAAYALKESSDISVAKQNEEIIKVNSYIKEPNSHTKEVKEVAKANKINKYRAHTKVKYDHFVKNYCRKPRKPYCINKPNKLKNQDD